MNLYILLVIGIILYFVNEWVNLKFINSKIQQTKNEIIQTINELKTRQENGTKI